jgi:hypothetical protein
LSFYSFLFQLDENQCISIERYPEDGGEDENHLKKSHLFIRRPM